MKKRILLILLVLLALLTAGCSAQTQTKAPKKSSLPSKEENATDAKSKAAAAKEALSIGAKVSLKDIQKYTIGKSSYEIYAIKSKDKDEFTIVSTDFAEPAFVDNASGESFTRLYPADREFMLNLDDEDLVVFTREEPTSAFPVAYDLTYFAPIVFSSDLSQVYLGTKDNVNAKQLLFESMSGTEVALPDGESFDISKLKLKINGTDFSDIKPMESTDEEAFGYYDGKSDDTSADWAFIHTGFAKELKLELSLALSSFEATLKPAIGFFGCGLEGDEPDFKYTQDSDGYYVYDFTSDANLASQLVKSCGVVDEEDCYSRLMIGDQAVLGFTSSAASVNNYSGATFIEVSWNKSTVTFWDDASRFDPSSSDVVMPQAYIEGDNWAGSDPDITGDIYTEFFTIPDPDAFVHIIFEPNAPTNNCPLDTVVVKITHPDGTVETFNGADRMMRGQTGIWYIDVYEQGN